MAPKQRVVDDPNTFIPPAVRRQAQLADAAFRAQRGEPPPTDAPSAETPSSVETPPAAPPDMPPSAEAPQSPPLVFPSADTPPIQVTPPVTPQVTQTPDETWERRYISMEGRYKRAEQDILAMSSQLASMQSLIASMNARPVTDETPPELRPQSFLTPEEVSEYGAEFLGVVGKRAKEELSPEVQALKAQIARLENQMKGNVEQAKTRSILELETTMDQRLPQWRDINVLPSFHAWLALPDMYSGAIRHQLLNAAYTQGNTSRVLAFFKGFLDQEAALVPRGQEPRSTGETAERVSLEDFAAPGRAKTAAATMAPAEKPIITRAQISQFYADSAAGNYRGREAEKNRLEAMIFEAQREGRIR